MERFCKNSLRLLAVDYFYRKAPLQIFDWVLNTPLRVTNIITIIRCKTMSRESSQENNCVRVSFYQINFLFHFIKKRHQHRGFPVNIAKFLRTTILINIRDGCPRKSTFRLSQETGVSRTSVLRILHDEIKLFPYNIQILQRQTDENKAERETFCEDISQRIENNPGLLDLNDLNNVGHRGFCGASVTLPVSQNLGTKH